MSTIKNEIPTINIQPWLDGSNADEVVSQVRSACVTYGFFQLVGHEVPLALQQQAFECARTFFSLPLDAKMLVSKDKLSGRGYEAIGTQALQPGRPADLEEVME